MLKFQQERSKVDIFTPDNTHWEWDAGEANLVYDGSIAELAKETHKTEDELYALLGEYEDESRNLQADIEEIEMARRGDY